MFRREAGSGHHQRGAGVLQSTQHTGAGEDQQHGHQPGHGPAQIVHGEGPDLATGTHQTHQGLGRKETRHGQHDPEQQRQPDAVAPGGEGLGQLAVAHRPGHGRRGGVGEEHHQPNRRVQHGGCQSDAGQLGDAQVADDGGIGEQEQRLGDQGAEGRNGEAQDVAGMAGRFAAAGTAAGRGIRHGFSLAGACEITIS